VVTVSDNEANGPEWMGDVGKCQIVEHQDQIAESFRRDGRTWELMDLSKDGRVWSCS
jgi:hypothetical protein